MADKIKNGSDPVEDIILKTKIALLFEQRFLGQIISRMDVKEAGDWCKTMATDGRNIYYNRDFVKEMTRSELFFVLGHEVFHAIFDHLGRRGNRQPELWNMANDYIVNFCLVKEGIGKMPEVGLYDEKYTDEMSSEEVYEMLKENSVEIKMTLDQHLEAEGDGDDDNDDEDSQGSGGGGQGGDEEGEGKGSGSGDNDDDEKGNGNKKISTTITGKNGPPKLNKEELEKIRQEMRAAVIRAAQQHASYTPGAIKRLVRELTEPKLDWRTMLEMHIQSAIKDDFTFQRPNRKSWAAGVCLPGQDFMETIDIMVWVDTSGSISDSMIKDFLGETKGIMQQFQDFKLKLACFDTRVHAFREFDQSTIDEIHDYEPGGGGGTDFMVMDEWMKKELENPPMKVVVFTDGFPFGEWGDESYCPDTLWIIHYDDTVEPPYGQKVLYEEGGRRSRRY